MNLELISVWKDPLIN